MNQFNNLDSIIPGNLAKVSRKSGDFYHLTWKEDQKTVTRYIRLDEVKVVRAGIKMYQAVKKRLDAIARTNLRALLKKRDA